MKKTKRIWSTANSMILVFTLILPMLLFGATGVAQADEGDALIQSITDADIVSQFVVADNHAGENCTENAHTYKEFGPLTAENAKYNTTGPVMTNGVVDPFFAKGGYQFVPTQKDKITIYTVAVDFDDCVGDLFVPYGLQSSVIVSGSATYDMSYPQVIHNMIFYGASYKGKGLAYLPNHIMNGSGSVTIKAVAQRLEEMSFGQMEVEVISLNELYAEALGLDTVNDKWPWFRLEGPMLGYSVQGPADCEDYRQFARLHQAGINAAYAGIPGLDIEDIDLIYTITPVTTHGHRSGLQGGAGLDTSFSYNDQALGQRDSEYRHTPGVYTAGGRVVGSGVFGVKGVTRSPSAAITTTMHELTHGLGMFDDYSYGSMGTNTGEVAASGSGSYGVMGSSMTSTSPDLPIWRKYRMGWIHDDEIVVLLPGQTWTGNIRALDSYTGDGGTYTNNTGIVTRMVVIPKEYRTRDTFGLTGVWTNGWNPNRLSYNWFDWFTNPWIGGETNAIKSFPTFYTLETRKPLGVDNGIGTTAQGVVVSYIANPTSETGHGAGGFKIMNTSNTGLKSGNTWRDQNIGLTVTVNSSGTYYDNVTITYRSAPDNAARHVYLGMLTASDSFVAADQSFAVDFDIFTLGQPAQNDAANSQPNAPVRIATPLGVPGGIAGFEMTVEFDANNLEFVSAGAAPFNYTVDTSLAASGTLVVKGIGDTMVDKDTILSLNFKAKTGAAPGDYTVRGTITDVTLLNWRGEVRKVGDPGFNGSTSGSSVGTIGAGTFAAFHTTATTTLTSNNIRSTGGKVTIGAAATYAVSGSVVCETPGPAPGSFIGVESTVTLYNSAGQAVASAKSDYDGNYSIKGVPAGSGYYITASKAKYNLGTSAAFSVSGNTVLTELKLIRQRFTVSGTVTGSYNSDGTGATPLAGVDVYLVNCGNAYEVVGGPVKTNASGQYTISGWEVGRAFVAVAVSVEGTQYEGLYLPQVHVAPTIHQPQAGINDWLALNLGLKFGEHANDYVYPANTATLGTANLYTFANTQNRTGRNVTLTQTQDVRLRMTTKSTAVSFQLRDMNGNAVGSASASRGTANGDDIVRNVPPGDYYIEASRSGYISACTMPISVSGTRVVLRNAAGTNYMDLVATGSGQTLAGTVYDAITGQPLQGVRIQNLPVSASYGAGVPIFTSATGTFSYPTVNAARYLTFSLEGYVPERIYRAAGAASNLRIELMPEYSVVFKDWDGTILSEQTVVYGNAAEAPAVPARYGWIFTGWDAEFTEVVESMLITAQYYRIPITEIAINAPAATTVMRGETYNFKTIFTDGALGDDIVWSISNQTYATVDDNGLVTVLNKTGTVILTVTDTYAGLSTSIVLRIV